MHQPSMGASGVWLFFVLSGFLLYLNFENSDVKEVFIKTPDYFYRRFFRLIPTYYLAIVVYAFAYTFVYNVTMTYWSLNHLFFLKASGHFWSVKVELIFYILLPLSLIFLSAVKNKAFKITVSFVMIFSVYYLFEYKKIVSINAASAPDLILFLTPFYIGIFISIIRNTLNQLFSTILFYFGVIGLLFFSLDFPFLLTARDFLPLGFSDNIGWRYPYIIYLLASFIVLGAYNSKPIILRNKAILALGTVAYSFYLWHILIIIFSTKITDNSLYILILTISGSYSMAYFSYKYVEKPSMNYAKRRPLAKLIKMNIFNKKLSKTT